MSGLPEQADSGTVPRRVRQTCVRSEQLDTRRFGNRDKASVVGCEIFPQLPDSISEQFVTVVADVQIRQSIPRLFGVPHRSYASRNTATKNLQHFDHKKLRSCDLPINQVQPLLNSTTMWQRQKQFNRC